MRAVLSDFDGTITKADVAELILQRFTGDAWLPIEAEHRASRIGTREAVARQFALVRAGREEMLDFVRDTAEIDESFHDFARFCSARGIHLEIVSEGLDFYVDYLTKRWRIDVPYRTNRTHFTARGLEIAYPHEDATCRLCGTCKLKRLFELRARGYRVTYIGDGDSDICPAIEADSVFAKGHLAQLCRAEEIPFVPFESFDDVLREMSPWP